MNMLPKVNKPTKVDWWKVRFPLAVEPKVDGERLLVYVRKGVFRALNRYRTVYLEEDLPRISGDVLSLGVDVVLDGEMVAGNSVYDVVKNYRNARLMVFDILWLNGKTLTELEYRKRKEFLRKFEAENIIPVEWSVVESREEVYKFFERSVSEGFEGVVLKGLGGYWDSWFKLKKYETRDFAVLGVRKTEGFLETGLPQSLLLGLWNGREWVRVGYVSSGLKTEYKYALTKILPKIREGEDLENVYVKPVLVVEVKYQDVNEEGLRHPILLRFRTDKSPYECRL